MRSTREPEWAPAELPVRQAGVQVRVVSANVGHVALMGLRGERQSDEPLLSIKLEIKNITDTRKIDYRSWSGWLSGWSDSHAELTDNFDDEYDLVSFGDTEMPVGAFRSKSIYPGKSLTDVIFFEQPVEKVHFLNLELPADKFGGTGVLRIRIPRTMIRR